MCRDCDERTSWPSTSKWFTGAVNRSFSMGYGVMRECYLCHRRNMPIAYWMVVEVDGTTATRNVCNLCGEPIYHMQRLGDLVETT